MHHEPRRGQGWREGGRPNLIKLVFFRPQKIRIPASFGKKRNQCDAVRSKKMFFPLAESGIA